MGRRTLSQFLITIDDALRALAEARTPEQLIDLSNTGETLRRYAQRAQLGMAAQNKCAELRLRAKRRLGDFLATTARLRRRPKSVPQANSYLPTLSDLASRAAIGHWLSLHCWNDLTWTSKHDREMIKARLYS